MKPSDLYKSDRVTLFELHDRFVNAKERSQSDLNEYNAVFDLLVLILDGEIKNSYRQEQIKKKDPLRFFHAYAKSIIEFDENLVEQFKRKLLSRNSDQTTKNRINRAKTIFKFALVNGWIEKNPFANVKIEFDFDAVDERFDKILKRINEDKEKNINENTRIWTYNRKNNYDSSGMGFSDKEDAGRTKIESNFMEFKSILFFVRYAGLQLSEKVESFEDKLVKIKKINNSSFRLLPVFPELAEFTGIHVRITQDFKKICQGLKIDWDRFIVDSKKQRVDELVKQGFDLFCISSWFNLKPETMSQYSDAINKQVEKATKDPMIRRGFY